MFKKFFKRKNTHTMRFLTLESSPLKDKYFIRTKPWDWLNKEQIYVASKIEGKPTMITMEFWPQEIYLNADGQITVSELLQIAKKQYLDANMFIPDGLDSILISALESLVNELEIVEFRDVKTTLPSNIFLPISKHSVKSDI